MNEHENLIKDFIKDQKILIVDPASSVQTAISHTVMSLGAAPENIILSKKFQDSMNSIRLHKPRVVFSEFLIENKFGLSLIDLQAEFYDDADKIAVLVTQNASDTAVAEAAEGHVDDYVLKPFPSGNLKDRLQNIILKKLKPSDYLQKIIHGKKYLAQREFDKAAAEFNDAAMISELPTLAFYYGGYTHHLQRKYTAAVAAYRQSRALQKLHYKSVMGEFDALYAQEKYKDAFEMIKTIQTNYPINSKRLSQFIIAAVYSKNLTALREFFELYKKIDQAPSHLTNIYATAFMTVGRHFIRTGSAQEARISFEYGLRIKGPQLHFIDRAIRELVSIKAFDDAQSIFRKIPGELVGSKNYVQLKFLIDQYYDDTHDFIEKGRKLVAQGYADRDCYLLLTRVLLEMRKDVLAEAMAIKAVQDYPDLRDVFNLMLRR